MHLNCIIIVVKPNPCSIINLIVAIQFNQFICQIINNFTCI